MAPDKPDDKARVKDMLRRQAGIVDDDQAKDLDRWFGTGKSDEPPAPPKAPPAPVVDASSAEDLERWFSMPSFQELAENPDAAGPEVAAEIRAARERAISSIRPEFVSAMYARNEPPDAYFKADIEPYNADIALFDDSMLEHGVAVSGETRELEVSQSLINDMDENAPQALLRDLHRVVSHFELALEIVDYGSMQRLDVVEAVHVAMSTSWKLPPLDRMPAAACQAVVDEYRAARRIRWDTLHVDKVVEDMSVWEAAGAE